MKTSIDEIKGIILSINEYKEYDSIVIIDDNGHLMFKTKGDANFVEDAYLCDSDKLIGRVIFVSVFVGKTMRLLSNPLIFIPVIALPLVYILISSIVDAVKIARKISEEEDKDV